MDRKIALERIYQQDKVWDVIVIGGGASGLGIAVDAASRGYSTVLFEAHDFAKGTSGRSTKLVHGGVRYLAQGRIRLVREALRERGHMARNARHLVHDMGFIIPCYRWWEPAFYRIGLGIYDLLAGTLSLGGTKLLSRTKVLQALPNIRHQGLRGGVYYHDGSFDDARFAIDLARTAVDHDACVINHAPVVDLRKDAAGIITGVQIRDALSGEMHEVKGGTVVNATGVFTNSIFAMDGPDTKGHVAPSQGIHLVVDGSFLPGGNALLIPHTTDGRVLFAIPWQQRVLIGTTDTAVEEARLEPQPLETEIDLVLANAGRYLAEHPTRANVLCMFAGLRPLAAPDRPGQSTKEVSRSHKVLTSASGLVSIVGGKWTTYRQMAEDVVDHVRDQGHLRHEACRTRDLPIHGDTAATTTSETDHLAPYGTEAAVIRAIQLTDPATNERIHPDHPFTAAEVVHAVRQEMAVTVEDVLARRVRLLFRDARAAIDAAEPVARIMSHEAGHDQAWVEEQVATFQELAKHYLPFGPDPLGAQR